MIVPLYIVAVVFTPRVAPLINVALVHTFASVQIHRLGTYKDKQCVECDSDARADDYPILINLEVAHCRLNE